MANKKTKADAVGEEKQVNLEPENGALETKKGKREPKNEKKEDAPFPNRFRHEMRHRKEIRN